MQLYTLRTLPLNSSLTQQRIIFALFFPYNLQVAQLSDMFQVEKQTDLLVLV